MPATPLLAERGGPEVGSPPSSFNCSSAAVFLSRRSPPRCRHAVCPLSRRPARPLPAPLVRAVPPFLPLSLSCFCLYPSFPSTPRTLSALSHPFPLSCALTLFCYSLFFVSLAFFRRLRAFRLFPSLSDRRRRLSRAGRGRRGKQRRLGSPSRSTRPTPP